MDALNRSLCGTGLIIQGEGCAMLLLLIQWKRNCNWMKIPPFLRNLYTNWCEFPSGALGTPANCSSRVHQQTQLSQDELLVAAASLSVGQKSTHTRNCKVLLHISGQWSVSLRSMLSSPADFYACNVAFTTLNNGNADLISKSWVGLFMFYLCNDPCKYSFLESRRTAITKHPLANLLANFWVLLS